eukprot:CAMPEP_0174737724 /NCGR_PEP_ID=MMETSP1094-20130205/68774_1 /TAXON_ID=156173 /ORGANISM="Chrysochromulina brevifilum, Strain UTEX LB 985" /LENGTH=125 /DNA_ID=CAMNT_0015940997 /DNA_START=168 /DNA_END=542 /DNA_ORIENTATION=+
MGTHEPGSHVRIRELKSRPELNGECSTIVSFNAAKGRFAVKVSDGSILLLKPENLEVVENLEVAGLDDDDDDTLLLEGNDDDGLRQDDDDLQLEENEDDADEDEDDNLLLEENMDDGGGDDDDDD